jgi:fatty-acyl-CoA synthase
MHIRTAGPKNHPLVWRAIMKLAFSTLGCPEWSFSDILAAACDLGYDGVEIRGVQSELYAPKIAAFLPENIDSTRASLDRLGLTIPCLTSACELQQPGEGVFFECKNYIGCAASLSIPYIRILGNAGPAPEGWVDEDRVQKAAALLAAYAEKRGVTLLLESNGYFANTGRLAGLIEFVGSPALAALWDLNHPFRYFDETPKATIENIGRYVRHVHVKDSIEENGAVKYKMMGQGTLPVAECVDRLHALGFDGYFSLEWVRRWQPSLEEPGIAFALFVEYMRSLLV